MLGEGVTESTPVPIVRCRDCAHFRENLMYGDSYTWCDMGKAMGGRLTPPDGYCWRGERREA